MLVAYGSAEKTPGCCIVFPAAASGGLLERLLCLERFLWDLERLERKAYRRLLLHSSAALEEALSLRGASLVPTCNNDTSSQVCRSSHDQAAIAAMTGIHTKRKHGDMIGDQ